MQLPRPLARLLCGAPLSAETIGMSGDRVYRVETSPVCYLKISAGSELPRETAALRWLAGQIPVPEVRYFGTHAGISYLLSTALPGRMACERSWTARPLKLAMQLGWALRVMHTLPIENCPLHRELDTALALAEQRVSQNLVDAAQWEAENQGRTPRDVLKTLIALRPAEDLVFTHGDYCLPNVFFDEEGLTGFLDLGRCGIADRHQDLALCLRSLKHNLGSDAYGHAFLRAYGLAEADEEKLRYYLLLDELF